MFSFFRRLFKRNVASVIAPITTAIDDLSAVEETMSRKADKAEAAAEKYLTKKAEAVDETFKAANFRARLQSLLED